MQDGFRIANLRIEKGLSQKDMAKILGIGITTYKKYEAGASIMKLEQINIISNMFDASIDYLLGLTNKIDCQKISSEIDYKYLRFSLKYHRRMKRIEQIKLAKDFKVSTSTISSYEKFAYNISAAYLVQFAKRFYISIDYICGKTMKKEVL